MIKISTKKTITQHLYNDGKNEDNLRFEKNTILFDAIRDKVELIQTNKKYPENDLQEIDLTLDVVIMTTKEWSEYRLSSLGLTTN